jgi:hypothetical protein
LTHLADEKTRRPVVNMDPRPVELRHRGGAFVLRGDAVSVKS